MLNFPIIAGPCAAESEEQILQIAEFLSTQTSVKTMRAGVWKARTNPDSFEGIGTKALEWLQKAKKQSGLQMATEVASAKQFEECLQYGIDLVWLGARTSANPIAVQEIANAAKGNHIRVAVKNPVNPDAKLWIGNIERFEKVGKNDVFAIHRGFSSANNHFYRNAPMWEIVIEMKRLRPDLTIFCDPSHIAGKREWVEKVAQQSVNMAMQGLMVEVHHHPEVALSDSKQQLNFNEFVQLLHNIRQKVPSSTQEIENLRVIIDDLDAEFLNILAKRMNIVKQIGNIKQKNNITALQMERWQKILDERLLLSQKLALNPDFIEKIFNFIHAEALKLQE
ncbi:cytochrome c4 [Bacteroidia bacterium]|nr:cytochrome c4 [Bacteroidia bacterium]